MSAFRDRKAVACECGNHVFAATTQGYVVLVSPQDAHVLSSLWMAYPSKRSAIVSRRVWDGKTGRTVVMSRLIVKPAAGLFVDHINSDGTDNRRENLREATSQQNSFNRRPEKIKAVASKGVHLTKKGRYQALIQRDGKRRFLGYFSTEEAAAAAYASAAKELHGEFARLA